MVQLYQPGRRGSLPWLASQVVNESEAVLIAWVAAQCRTMRGRERHGPIMRYGRVFAPGVEVGGGVPIPAMSGRNAYAHAVATGLIFAEGCAITASGIVYPQAWCLDGDIVVDPTHARENRAFFGVAVTAQFLRRLHELNRYDDGGDGFRGMLDANNHAGFHPDPATDLLLGAGREVPAWIREWSLDDGPEPGGSYRVNPPQDIIERLRREDSGEPDPL